MACNFTNLLPGSETSAHKMLPQDKPLGKVTYTVMASDWSHLSTIISSVCTEAPGWHGDEVSKAGRYRYYIVRKYHFQVARFNRGHTCIAV